MVDPRITVEKDPMCRSKPTRGEERTEEDPVTWGCVGRGCDSICTETPISPSVVKEADRNQEKSTEAKEMWLECEHGTGRDA